MSDREELSTLVRTKVGEVLGVDPGEITESTHLGDDYDADSLELMEIGARLEMALNTRIGVDELSRVQTVGHAIDLLVERRTGA